MARRLKLSSRCIKEERNFDTADPALRVKYLKLLYIILTVKDQMDDPTGKPEQLRGNLKGYWSRRINDQHRVVYQVTESSAFIESCWGHYDD